MTRPGRVLRQIMMDDAHERAHPERVAERVRARRAAERAHAETMTQFGELTAENIRAALEWQDRRISELLSGES